MNKIVEKLWMLRIAIPVVALILITSPYLTGNACLYIESTCYDWNDKTVIDHKYCREMELCNEYCNEKYGTNVSWNTCCVTDGNPPTCVNIQGCACE